MERSLEGGVQLSRSSTNGPRGRRPRLLYLGHNLPYPPHEGALIRSYHTVRILSDAFDVTGLYFYRSGASPTEVAREEALAELSSFGDARAFPIPQEESAIRLGWDHLRSVLTRTPYTRWMHASRQVDARLRSILREGDIDLVHVDSLDLLGYLPSVRGLPVVLAHHNVESQLLRRRAEPERGLKRAYIRWQADLVEAAERHWCPRVDLNVAVSLEDREVLERVAPGCRVVTIPNGVDTSSFSPSEGRPQGGMVFVGGHSWFPNRDGMEFFAEAILPLVRRRLPGATVRWIGKAPEAARRSFATSGVEVLGYVPDIRPEVSRARCVVVPLRVGGGTRLKILDAWAMGKAVVSTTLGCEGLEAEHGRNILIADRPDDFAACVASVLTDEGLRSRLEKAARETAVQRYDWGIVGRRMQESYLALLRTEGLRSP